MEKTAAVQHVPSVLRWIYTYKKNFFYTPPRLPINVGGRGHKKNYINFLIDISPPPFPHIKKAAELGEVKKAVASRTRGGKIKKKSDKH
jgi:hypothetical protein